MDRYVTIDEISASAFVALGLDNDEYRNVFANWAYQATRSIGLTTTQLTTATLTISNGTATPPSGMVMPYAFALKKSNADEYAYPFFDSNFWKDIPSNEQANRRDDYIINYQGGQFVFSSRVEADGYDRLLIQYYGLPVDEDGIPLVPEYYIRAVTAYIEYMYIKQQRYRKRTEIPMSEVQILNNEWLKLKLDAVRWRNTPSKPEIDAAIQEYMTMLPNFSRLNRQQRGKYYND